jgi:glucose/arabinose dehydrogenase
MIGALSFVLMAAWATAATLGLRLLLQRWAAGVAALVFGVVAAAAQAALSLVPVGIGEPLIRIPATAFAATAAAGVAGGALLGLRIPLPRRVQLLAALGVPAAAAALWGLAVASTPARERERDVARRAITLPPGFRIGVFADAASVAPAEGTFDNPTALAFGDGALFVADIDGNIWRGELADADGDGRSDRIGALRKYASGFSLLVGLAWRGGELYASSAGKVEALRDANGDGRADARRTLVDGLPSMVLAPHTNNGLTFGPDGRLYFGVGSTVASGPEPNPRAGAILSVEPDGGDVRVEANGFGNPFDVAFDSEGMMFTGDSRTGGEAGDAFHALPRGGARAAVVEFDVHATPTGVAFYDGDAFPPAYRGAFFAALWTRGDVVGIETARAADGTVTARAYPFAGGFLYPIDVAVGPDGALYVADFGTSVVHRIEAEAPQ